MKFIPYRKWWQRNWRVYVGLPNGKWRSAFTVTTRESAEELASDLTNMPKSALLEASWQLLT